MMERTVALLALFVALIVVLGLLPQLSLPFGVPITAQSLGVMLAGCILGSRLGGLAVLIFVGLALLGLPLLAGGRGGLGVLAGPTVGFIIGFPLAAFVVGWVVERTAFLPIGLSSFFGCLIGGIIVLYGFGIIGMAFILEKSLLQALALVGIFLIGDMIKAILAALISGAIHKARPQIMLSRK